MIGNVIIVILRFPNMNYRNTLVNSKTKTIVTSRGPLISLLSL